MEALKLVTCAALVSGLPSSGDPMTNCSGGGRSGKALRQVLPPQECRTAGPAPNLCDLPGEDYPWTAIQSLLQRSGAAARQRVGHLRASDIRRLLQKYNFESSPPGRRKRRWAAIHDTAGGKRHSNRHVGVGYERGIWESSWKRSPKSQGHTTEATPVENLPHLESLNMPTDVRADEPSADQLQYENPFTEEEELAILFSLFADRPGGGVTKDTLEELVELSAVFEMAMDMEPGRTDASEEPGETPTDDREPEVNNGLQPEVPSAEDSTPQEADRPPSETEPQGEEHATSQVGPASHPSPTAAAVVASTPVPPEQPALPSGVSEGEADAMDLRAAVPGHGTTLATAQPPPFNGTDHSTAAALETRTGPEILTQILTGDDVLSDVTDRWTGHGSQSSLWSGHNSQSGQDTGHSSQSGQDTGHSSQSRLGTGHSDQSASWTGYSQSGPSNHWTNSQSEYTATAAEDPWDEDDWAGPYPSWSFHGPEGWTYEEFSSPGVASLPDSSAPADSSAPGPSQAQHNPPTTAPPITSAGHWQWRPLPPPEEGGQVPTTPASAPTERARRPSGTPSRQTETPTQQPPANQQRNVTSEEQQRTPAPAAAPAAQPPTSRPAPHRSNSTQHQATISATGPTVTANMSAVTELDDVMETIYTDGIYRPHAEASVGKPTVAPTPASAAATPDPYTESACESFVELRSPFYAMNTQNMWKMLINMPPFETYIHMEHCVAQHSRGRCAERCRCTQRFTVRTMPVYERDANNCDVIYMDKFLFPSHCDCACLPASLVIFNATLAATKATSPAPPLKQSPPPAPADGKASEQNDTIVDKPDGDRENSTYWSLTTNFSDKNWSEKIKSDGSSGNKPSRTATTQLSEATNLRETIQPAPPQKDLPRSEPLRKHSSENTAVRTPDSGFPPDSPPQPASNPSDTADRQPESIRDHGTSLAAALQLASLSGARVVTAAPESFLSSRRGPPAATTSTPGTGEVAKSGATLPRRPLIRSHRNRNRGPAFLPLKRYAPSSASGGDRERDGRSRMPPAVPR